MTRARRTPPCRPGPGADGAWTKTRASGVTADGEVHYFDVYRVAGPHGAATVTTAAHS
ncbi:hypothetical protein [Streptomyces albidoflavus]|uniref:hypothetical protein n=1 Tax=Streptomyces albidoflavus TaxID=1886 RepID=UPI0033E4C942